MAVADLMGPAVVGVMAYVRAASSVSSSGAERSKVRIDSSEAPVRRCVEPREGSERWRGRTDLTPDG